MDDIFVDLVRGGNKLGPITVATLFKFILFDVWRSMMQLRNLSSERSV